MSRRNKITEYWNNLSEYLPISMHIYCYQVNIDIVFQEDTILFSVNVYEYESEYICMIC